MTLELLFNILGSLVIPIAIVIFGEFRVWKIYNSEKYNYEKELYEIKYIERSIQEESMEQEKIEKFGEPDLPEVTYESKFRKNHSVYFMTCIEAYSTTLIEGEIFYKELISRKFFKTLISYKKLKTFENKKYTKIIDKKSNMICTIIVDNVLKLRLRNVTIEEINI